MQIWKNYEDGMRIFLRDPFGGAEIELVPVRGTDRIRVGGTELLIYYGEPSPFNAAQEIYIEFVPERTYVESGIWTFRFLGTGDEETAADLWLPSAAAVGHGIFGIVAGYDPDDSLHGVPTGDGGRL